jgi:hypothetical protein
MLLTVGLILVSLGIIGVCIIQLSHNKRISALETTPPAEPSTQPRNKTGQFTTNPEQ